MAEVTRVLGNLQFDTEGGLVPASGTEGLLIPSRRRSKLVKDGAKVLKDDPAAVGATKAGRKMAVARNKAVGCFTGEIGVTKVDAGNKEAAGGFTGEIGVTKVDAGNKDAAGSYTGEIGVTKAEPGNKVAACSFIGQIGVTKADEAAGSITGEVDLTKVEVGVAGKGVVTEKDWIEFVFPVNSQCPVEIEERITTEPPPTGAAMITKEILPGALMDRLKEKRVLRRLPPIDFTTPGSDVYIIFPEMREGYLSNMVRWNYLVDLHENCLKQHAKKGFAEVGVDFTDGVKKIFILPQEQGCAP